MKTIKEDWETLFEKQFAGQFVPDAQKEVLQWAFYRGAFSLMVKINNMAEECIPEEEAVDSLNRLRIEVVEYFDSLTDRRH